ncbi:DNA replication/repair protein RecF [Agathobaculum sp.]|uniref:DNA replication/repair protein RecF n=1 Tax=Agathobaculum sp. TaxID=2048138 RepID=UPI002A83E179|nr:DNA replication/repair protein RecF [Agathobaculum sp.]MDY3618433.1 DNA replication/repair protein RecF [Agathobaculum sp.]
MHLNALKLHNFRNYEQQSFEFDPGVNLICGENGQGKTNLLEAAAALSTMRLFRTAQKKEGLRFETDDASIEGSFCAQQRDFTLEMRLFRAKPMEVYKNGVRQKRQSDAAGIFKTVLFCPDDLLLVRQGAAARRRFLDTALCQLRPNYARCLEEYGRLHEHKTRILRDSEEHPSLLSLWEDFSLRMAKFGAHIIRYRAYYIRKLLDSAAAVHAGIAPQETLSGEYKTVSDVSDPFAPVPQIEQELIRHVFRHKQAEIAAKSCLSGPHKDDLLLSLGGRSAASYGSQGQVRTCTLSLKLAERELFFGEDGEYPVLLLDDVLSELDKKRQDFVLNRISGGQVLITCCEDGILDKLHAGRVFPIENGKII